MQFIIITFVIQGASGTCCYTPDVALLVEYRRVEYNWRDSICSIHSRNRDLDRYKLHFTHGNHISWDINFIPHGYDFVSKCLNG